MRASPGGRPLAKLSRRTEWRSPRVLPALGERRGWLRVMAAELANGGTGWIPASAAGLTWSPWQVRASLGRREVEVLERGRVVRRFPVAIGRPATPTPTGTFAVTDKLWIGGGPSAYGCCAIALTGHQPHIEPGWRGGDRLAIHGTDSPGTIGAAASFGCLRASDADARWLVRRLYLGTIVEIRP
jgi:lipoprotein-anchoring transpeptidase ErfK/SrfK